MKDETKTMKFFSPVAKVKEVDSKINTLTDSEREIIKICKKIRLYAATGRVNLEKVETAHTSGSDNLHLKRFVEMCGISFREFVLQYLCYLQPFQLELDKDQQFGKYVRCIIDLSYNISLYLKIEFSGEVIVISFHENQRKKNKKYAFRQNGLTFAFSKTNAAIGDTILTTFKIVHGFLVFEPELFCKVVDIDLVKFNLEDMSNELLRFVNVKVDNLLESEDRLDVFNSLKEVSVTSFGETILNDISVLVDSLMTRGLSSSKRGLLLTALNNKMFELLALPNSEDYVEALNERYTVKLGSLVMKQRDFLGLNE